MTPELRTDRPVINDRAAASRTVIGFERLSKEGMSARLRSIGLGETVPTFGCDPSAGDEQ